MRKVCFSLFFVLGTLCIISAGVVSCGKASRHTEQNDVTLKFNSTWNIYEQCALDDNEDIVYKAVAWGGLVGSFLERNMTVDLSDYESITFQFAEPLPVPVQVVVANRFKTVGKQGLTSLTCYFDGQDVTSVNEIVLQPHDSCDIVVKDVYLTPNNAQWESAPIWKGACQLGNWENGFVVKPDFFANAYEGDKIEFVFNTDQNDPDVKYWLIKTIYNGTSETLEGNDSELNNYGCASVSSHATIYRIPLTATDIANLQTTGLFVNGYFVNIKQVNLLSRVYSDNATE